MTRYKALPSSKDSNAERQIISTDVGRSLWQIGGQDATNRLIQEHEQLESVFCMKQPVTAEQTCAYDIREGLKVS